MYIHKKFHTIMKCFLTIVAAVCLLGGEVISKGSPSKGSHSKGSNSQGSSEERPRKCPRGCKDLVEEMEEKISPLESAQQAQQADIDTLKDDISKQQTLITQLIDRIAALEPVITEETGIAPGCPTGKIPVDCHCAGGSDCPHGLNYQFASPIRCGAESSNDEVTISCVPGSDDSVSRAGSGSLVSPMKTLDCYPTFPRMTSCVSSVFGSNIIPGVTIDNSGSIGTCQITCPAEATYCRADVLCTIG